MPELVQGGWPQVQTISTLSAIPSQWALQYFSFSGAMQAQAGLAHFLAAATAIVNLLHESLSSANDQSLRPTMPLPVQRMAKEHQNLEERQLFTGITGRKTLPIV